MERNDEMKMASPCVVFYKQINALFEKDPEVTVKFDEDKYTINLYVKTMEKAKALRELLPYSKKYDNATIKIRVVPGLDEELSKAELFERAFKNNPVVELVAEALYKIGEVEDVDEEDVDEEDVDEEDEIEDVPNRCYVVFSNEVVQYFVDDSSCIFGVQSTLYQDIAKNVFGELDGILYCTDIDTD